MKKQKIIISGSILTLITMICVAVAIISNRSDTPINDSINIITGMPYTSLAGHESQQWALQTECKPNDLGIQCYYDKNEDKTYYTAAMGSEYGQTIGDTFHITLNNGSEFDVMLGDFKNDTYTKNQNNNSYTSVLEFIFDPETLDPSVQTYGTFTIIDFFGGLQSDKANIKSIKYTGQKWKYSENNDKE